MSNVYRIPRGDITLGQNLGSGGFGEVLAGTRRGGAPVAIKRLFDGLSEQSKTAFRREVDMMRQLRSEFVVSVHGLVDDPPHEPMLLVMERMHEALSSAYSSDPAPPLRQRVEWLLQAGKGICFLHAQSPPTLHRDIKPANMLLTSPATGRRLKISDLGLSKSLADITASLASRSTAPTAGGGSAAAAAVGTPHYMAPELMSSRPKYSAASDVYAFGVVCWETICMRLPYRACRNARYIEDDVKAGIREVFELEDRPDFVFPSALESMIERAWAQDPKDRPSMEQCVLVLQQFLARLGAEAARGHAPSSAVRPTAPRRSSPPPDSTVPISSRPAPNDSSILAAHDSSILGVQQLASLTDVQVAVLVDNVRPDFKTKGYGKAAVKNNVGGRYILEANESELTALFSQMNVGAVDMPTMRKAVSSWKANPAQVFQWINEPAQRFAALYLGKYVLHNGFIYVSAHLHDADAPDCIQDGRTPVDIVADFEVAPGDAGDISVANAYKWGSRFLVFSNGSLATSALVFPFEDEGWKEFELTHVRNTFSNLRRYGAKVAAAGYDNSDVLLRKRA